MDEKTKETEQENPVDTGAETSAEVEVAGKVAEPSAEVMPAKADFGATSGIPEGGAPMKNNKRLINALIRVGCALIVAAILITVTKLSIFDLIKRPAETDAAQNEEMGSFVKQDVTLLLGDLSDQGLSKNYMLAVSYDKIIVVHFTNRYLANATAIENDTLKFINGEITTYDKYVTVEGTIEKQSEDLSGKLYEWFDANRSWMQEKGVIYETNDAAIYLSDAVLTVDAVNSMSETLVWILTVLAALLLLYIIVELVLMACGVYLKEPKKKKAMSGTAEADHDEREDSGNDVQETAENSEETDEKLCEDADECIKDDEKPENNGSSEETSEEKTEIQEDK